jgi:hypothetical protein
MVGLIEGRTEKGMMARVYRLGLRSGQPCSNYKGPREESSSGVSSQQGNCK